MMPSFNRRGRRVLAKGPKFGNSGFVRPLRPLCLPVGGWTLRPLR